ncbi:MAG: hypothetical protein Q9159_005116 [Coniocarpon cinnabarinum]
MAGKIDRQSTTPFLLKLFYRSNDFHKIDEFTPTRQPSSYLQIYTWPNCSLRELSTLLTSTLPQSFESTAAGHRIAFRLVYPDMRSAPRTPDAPGRYAAKEMGSVIVGSSIGSRSGALNGDFIGVQDDDSEQTLQDFKFVVGDWVSCAILPPLSNGEVAPPPPSIAVGRGGYGGPPPRRFGDVRPPRENGYYGRGGRGGGYRGPGPDDGVPTGEWRRGERVPEGPPFRGGGGYGRGRGRW